MGGERRRALRDPPDPPEPWWRNVNRVFALIFLLELVLRIIAFRWSFWLRHDWMWNAYDCFVVGCSLLEEVVDTLNLNFMRALRVLRLARVLRFFTGLRSLMCAMLGCCMTLLWA